MCPRTLESGNGNTAINTGEIGYPPPNKYNREEGEIPLFCRGTVPSWVKILRVLTGMGATGWMKQQMLLDRE
jgi:hypothetical protein